jgi:hypothetical protein
LDTLYSSWANKGRPLLSVNFPANRIFGGPESVVDRTRSTRLHEIRTLHTLHASTRFQVFCTMHTLDAFHIANVRTLHTLHSPGSVPVTSDTRHPTPSGIRHPTLSGIRHATPSGERHPTPFEHHTLTTHFFSRQLFERLIWMVLSLRKGATRGARHVGRVRPARLQITTMTTSTPTTTPSTHRTTRPLMAGDVFRPGNSPNLHAQHPSNNSSTHGWWRISSWLLRPTQRVSCIGQ